jgi:hypothetical protein
MLSDWRVDVKTSSNLLSRMSVPTVLVGMKVFLTHSLYAIELRQMGLFKIFSLFSRFYFRQVQDIPTQVGVVPDVKNVQFELSKEALQTMLDGLNKIRDQLGAIQ